MTRAATVPVQRTGQTQSLSALMRNPPLTKSKNRREAEELQKTLDEGLYKRNNLNLAARILARRLVPPAQFVLCTFYPEHGRHFSPPLYLYVHDANALESV